ncbi:uncharacterized protein LOC121295823 [Polyodon spathula]|uniref:uncharacterized protein LOC121295823 n=1 Tax=Polyodon spathula TaxID=7913 RepID=UPI001B7E0421|nr:uncharacterized protein LOC121295823 [Polyodon spathula]
MLVSMSFGVSCCLLLSLSLNLGGVLLASGNDRLCQEGEQLLTRGVKKVDTPSECMLKCTLQTYLWMTGRRDRVTVRLHKTIPGKEGELCWSLQLGCGKGVLLQKAFVLLPLRDGALDLTAALELRPTFPAEPDLLSSLSDQAALSQECGLRFDITKAFTASKSTVQFCVEPLLSGQPAPRFLKGALECPPFLATVWQRHHQPPG